uniref:Uncharacterized protein n=1 Tax=Pithovirus LCPAC201 TaxID=2506591 RepID=A0A481Z5C7_9VIRU|nr:MAG: hypothetical protein LCPAC201_00360 [Pithovirus LCPAC201]
MLGMMIGIALISLDHLNKDDTTYLTVGIGMTSSLVGYWLPEPRAPGGKNKKVKSETPCTMEDGQSNSQKETQRSNGESGVPIPKKIRKIQDKLDDPMFSAGVDLTKNIFSGVKDEIDKEKQAMSTAGLTAVDIEVEINQTDGKCCQVSLNCFNPCQRCYSCFRSRTSWISKKNGKFLVFLVRSILSILGMIAGIVLVVLDKLNDQDGPYLTVGIGLISSIIGYWLPSPNRPNKNKKKEKPLSRKKLRKAKKEAENLRKETIRRKRRSAVSKHPNNIV